MADWKKIARAALLSDGSIDTKEVEILKKEIFADGKVDKAEVEFLASLRKGATKTVKVFDDLFFAALKDNVLGDGSIDAAEAKFLRACIFADGKVDAAEKKFVADLKAAAKSSSPEFAALAAEIEKA